MVYRIVNGGWALLFAYAAAVQVNDPDPAGWILVYGTAAVICLVAVADRIPVRPVFAFAVLALLFSAAAWLTDSGESRPMSGFPPWGPLREEVVREVLGLLLVAGWMAAIGVWTLRRRATTTS